MTENKGKNLVGDNRDNNVSVDLSKMSPADRAKLSLLIETDGDSELRQHLLGAMGRRGESRGSRLAARAEVPERWTQIHVLDRLEDAYRVLAMQPGTKGRTSSTVWPATAVEKMAILDMIELMGTGELEQRAEEKNRVRLQPTSLQISQMEQALAWPFQFLADWPELAKAIQLRSMWAAMGVDIRKRCERRGIAHDEFNRQWQAALSIITGALTARKVPVT